MPSQLRDQRLLSRESAPPQPRDQSVCLFIRVGDPLDQHLSAALSAPISCWITTCQPLDQRLSAALSSPNQLRDQRLLSRESAPPQPRDHSLSASLSESVICLISTCQQVEECLLSRANCITQSDDLRLLSPAISHLISNCQPHVMHLSAS